VGSGRHGFHPGLAAS